MISVIVCFYNEIDYIKLTLDSLQKQKFSNLEIILIDDFSNYELKLKSICNSYKTLNINLVRNNKNFGLARSRNIGLEIAKGKYISFLDSDDEYFPEKLIKQHNSIEKGNYDLVYSKELVKINNNFYERFCNRRFELEILLRDQYINLNTLLISKKFLDKFKLSFNNSELSRFGEDLEFLIELRKNTNNYFFIDEFVSISRRRKNNHRNYKAIWKEFEKLENLFSNYLYDKTLFNFQSIIYEKIKLLNLKKNIAYILASNKKKIYYKF